MKTITPAIELFTFEELKEDAKNTAINSLLDTWLEYGGIAWEEAQLAFNLAIAEAERMQTPWFAKEIVFRDCKEYIYEELNNWYFTENGKEYDYIELVDEEYEDEQ